MSEFIEESAGLESTTIGIYRTAATVKGGRRFSFGAFVVVGDRNGTVGLGYGKAPGVPAAIEKAQKNAKKNLVHLKLQSGTIPHEVAGRYLASNIRLIPASPGTGVIAGGTARAVIEMAGIKDCLTKSYGSNNQKNLAKATLEGLLALRTKDEVQKLRGIDLGKSRVDEILELGEKFAPSAPAATATATKPATKEETQKADENKQEAKKEEPKKEEPKAEAAPAEDKPAEDAPAPEASEDENKA